MRLSLFLCCLAASALLTAGAPSHNDLEEWTKFKATYNKTYSSANEENDRMEIFLDNKNRIDKHNQLYKNGLVSYTMGVNKFSDMTETEFRSFYTGSLNPGQSFRRESSLNTNRLLLGGGDLPRSVDWREANWVTPVKEQKECLSCWIFSAVGAVESQHYNKTGELVTLSEQNVVDCVNAPVDEGHCRIGWMDTAFEYILNNGIDTEESYPYEAEIKECRFDPSKIGATITGYADLPPGDEKVLKRAVATVGPVSVAIDSKDGDFQHYKNGVYHSDTCLNTEDKLDHALLVIGYGKENGQPYWLVKNSWGTTWGEDGFGKIARNMDNHCGIATKASYPVID
ncbi:C1 family peptidase [Alcanivorax quisquiliarum]|uniref:C1 family peptidase n=1 Tax=Alcanivorax quisquiliarum TaxID=2933565 RepID=A0ABT0EAR5_9GAMM|nr:C1 family peptidase [Alcanivorax quisquiliarum]MCK0538909.1 C1 family peptidase [Alcanivorax quisquiliarum]